MPKKTPPRNNEIKAILRNCDNAVCSINHTMSATPLKAIANIAANPISLTGSRSFIIPANNVNIPMIATYIVVSTLS